MRYGSCSVEAPVERSAGVFALLVKVDMVWDATKWENDATFVCFDAKKHRIDATKPKMTQHKSQAHEFRYCQLWIQEKQQHIFVLLLFFLNSTKILSTFNHQSTVQKLTFTQINLKNKICISDERLHRCPVDASFSKRQ